MKNRLKAVSLFSNVGIAEIFFKEIGIDVIVANEIDVERARFYEHLYPDTKMIIGDIKDVSIQSKILNSFKGNEIDLLIATPPCQGMSLAGKRDPLDERNQLVYYAIKMIKKIKPKYVFLENVPQALTTKIRFNKNTILIPQYLIEQLSGNYYFAKKNIVSAQDYGVPQMRKRNIFLLTRKDCKVRWEIPNPMDRITLEDAIGKFPIVDPLLKEGLDETLKLFPKYLTRKNIAEKFSKFHTPPKHSKKHVICMMNTPTGNTAFKNKYYYPKKDTGEKVNGHYNTYRRLAWNKPSRTMTQNSGVISSLCCVHPGRPYITDDVVLYDNPRCLTLLELFVVTTLPTNWNVPIWANEKLIRKVIGEGIPPVFVKNLILNLTSYL